MNRELCHTCQYEHNWIACSGCEHDNDEYVQAEWFTKKEAEIRADEKRKCEEEFKRVLENHWLNGTVAHRIIDEILAEYEKDQKGGIGDGSGYSVGCGDGYGSGDGSGYKNGSSDG